MPVVKFTYTNDPGRSPRDAVRFFTGDVDRDAAMLDDDEIDWSISENPNPRIAAAVLLDQLAARYARKANISVGQVSKALGDVSEKLSKQAEKLRTAASSRGALPFFGGLTISGKDALDQRTDDVQPHFRLGQFDNPEVRQFDSGGDDSEEK